MKLYRAVDDDELADIVSTRRSRCIGSASGKYFAGAVSDAVWFGKNAYREFAPSPFTVVQVRVHSAIASTLCPDWSDGFWTWYIDADDLPSLVPDILNAIPLEFKDAT